MFVILSKDFYNPIALREAKIVYILAFLCAIGFNYMSLLKCSLAKLERKLHVLFFCIVYPQVSRLPTVLTSFMLAHPRLDKHPEIFTGRKCIGCVKGLVFTSSSDIWFFR